MYALRGQIGNQLGQLLIRHGTALLFMADFVILAVYAAQRAGTEKDGATAARTGQAGFLPVVRSRAGYHRARAHAAIALAMGFIALGSAHARTKRTNHGLVSFH